MKPSKRSKRRARQTRLKFEPIPSSSPAASQLSPQVRDKAAVVGYEGSPLKKRRVANDESTAGKNGSQTGLPTPAQSSQLHLTGPQLKEATCDSDSESDPVNLAQRRNRSNTFIGSGRKKSKDDPNVTQSGKKKTMTDESESSSEDLPKTQRRSKRAKVTDHASSTKTKNAKEKKQSTSLSPPPNWHATRSSQHPKKNQKKYLVITSDEEESGSDSDDLEIVDAPQKAGRYRDSDFGEAESSSDEILVSSPSSVKKRRVTKKAPEVYSEEEESDDVGPVTPKRKRKRASTTPEERDEDLVVTQSKPRRPPNKEKQRQEEEDLAEDLEFLGRSPKKLRRKSPPRPMSAREKALEALRRRRAGEKDAQPELEEQPQNTQRRALYDTDSEDEADSEDEETEEDEEKIENLDDEPRSTIHQASTMAMFQEDAEDESFVVEDEDDTLGVPDEDVQIPLEFTSMSRMKGKDLFKYAVEWMVHKKLNPAFPSNDEIYALTFRKLDDEVKGLAGSKFTSSAWTPEFTRALHARPLIEISEISRAGADFIGDHCMACNRRGHPATFNIFFRGHPYHKSTLEEVDYDSDSDSDEDSDDGEKSYDSRGNPVPPQDAVFHVGVFCKTNAQTAHTLAHWRYHLNDWVVDWLAAEGHLSPDKIVERDSWKDKKKRKYANKVVDEMATKGEIKRLHQDFRSEIDAARNAKQAGWDRFNRD